MNIPVFYIGSEGLTDVMSVSMISMLMNTKTKLSIRVLDCGIGNFQKRILTEMCMSYESCESIDFISIDPKKEFAGFPSYMGFLDAWVRLLIPRLCPEFDRVLYIDGDTVVVGDIMELWNEDLEGMAVGAVPDYITWSHSEIVISKENLYFMDGVMILDLEKLRKMDFEKLVRNIDVEHRNKFTLAEQDALNVIFCNNNFKLLHRRYNNAIMYQLQWNPIYDDMRREQHIVPDDLLIAHFAFIKPWSGDLAAHIANAELWWHYAAMSPYFHSLWARNCIALNKAGVSYE